MACQNNGFREAVKFGFSLDKPGRTAYFIGKSMIAIFPKGEILMQNARTSWKWAMGLLGLSAVMAAVFLAFLPDTIPMHYNASWEVDRYGSKYEMLFFPGVALVLCVFFRFSQKLPAGNKKLPAFLEIFFLALWNLLELAFFLLAWWDCSGKSPLPEAGSLFSKGIGLLFGVLLILMGFWMPKVERNSLAGLRTSWSMKNDAVWQKSQQFGGYAFVVCGFLVLAASVFLSDLPLLISIVGVVVLGAIVSSAASYQIWKTWQKEHPEE